MGGASEADIVQMDAVNAPLDILHGAGDDLVEIFLLVAVVLVIDGIDPLAVLVEGLEPDVDLAALLLGILDEGEGRVHAVGGEGFLVENDVLDILGDHLVDVDLGHILGPEPEGIGIRFFFLAGSKHQERSERDKKSFHSIYFANIPVKMGSSPIP